MARRRKGIPGLSFSWKRALGISAAKGRLSRQIGIPLTRQGRQRKVGRAMGCCIPLAVMLISSMGLAAIFLAGGEVFAHGGRTDSSGGHTNRKTGEYHYHGSPRAGSTSSSKKPASTSQSPEKKIPSKRGTIVGTASVIDGDTIEIHGQRIRLHGIDAPESSQTCIMDGTPWRCGAEAANKLSEKIGRQTVICDKRDTDRYGRAVAVCSVKGQDLNAWLVAQGLAVAYREYSTDYVNQESIAKIIGTGLWSSEFDMPWDWRKSRKK